MKTKKVLLLFFGIALLFSSCNRKDTYYTVKGRLTTDCSGNPVANQELSLKQSSSIFMGGGIFLSTTTDANGNFSFTYNSKDCDGGDFLEMNLSGPFFENIPANENIDLGTLINNGTANFTVSIITSKPFSIADTLYYTNYVSPSSNPYSFIIGPFSNQVLDSIVNLPLSGTFRQGENYSTLSVRYYVNHANMNRYKDVEFNVDNCGSWGNVNIVLE